jgi:TPR repeat protein
MADEYYKAGDLEMTYRCYLENAMTAVDGEALFELGVMYLYGYYVDQDFDKAGHYFKLAYDVGHKLPGSAYIMIAGCKEEQEAKTEEAQLKWFRLATENGCEYGYECIGELYMNKGDYRKAHEYFIKPEKKESLALYNLGRIYDEGLGVEKDREIAIEYYKRTLIECREVRDYGDISYEQAENRLKELGIEVEIPDYSEE